MLGTLLCAIDTNDAGVGALCDGVEAVYRGAVERIALSDWDELRADLERRHADESDDAAVGIVTTSVPTTILSLEVEDAVGQAAAIREYVAGGASVIATMLVDPDAHSPAIDEALAADIPVVSFNSGAEVADQAGAALHVALNDHEARRIVGEEFNRREVEGTVLCVIHEPNNVGLHDRCDGFEEVYQGSVERWSAETPTDVWNELAARLGAGDISAILTLSVHSAWDALVTRAIHDIDLDIATFGFSVGLARSVADGSVMFSILDHPEIQAYMSTVASVVANRWRLDPVAYFDGM